MFENGGFNTRHFRAIVDFVVFGMDLPFDVEDLLELRLLETFKIFQLFSTQGSCLASVLKGGDYNGADHHEFCSEGGSVVVEYALPESSEGPLSGVRCLFQMFQIVRECYVI